MEITIKKLENLSLAPYDLLLDADPNRTEVDLYLNRGYLYVAELDGEVVGEYVLIDTRPFMMEIMNVAVAPGLQGKGIGKKLTLHAIETARAMGAKSVEIGTGNCGFSQMALYQKCGFRIVGVEFDFFVGHCEEKIYENGIWCRDMIRMRIDF